MHGLTIKLVTLSFVATVAGNLYSQQSGHHRVVSKTVFVEFDFDSLLNELAMNQPLQRSLNFTDDQLAKIAELRSSRQYSQQKREILRRSSSDGEITAKTDSAIQSLLKDVVTSSQLSELKRWQIQTRYLGQFKDVVRSDFTIRYCELVEHQAEYYKTIEDVYKNYQAIIGSTQESHVRDILEFLPEAGNARTQMAQLVGEKYYPAAVVKNDIDVKTVPFPPGALSLALIPLLANDPELVEQAEITPKQMLKCNELYSNAHGKLNEIMQIKDF